MPFYSFSQLSQAEILAKADEYVAHIWTASSSNIQKGSCGGGYVQSAPWVEIGENESLPYCWGGYSTLSSFDSGISKGKSAGDINTASVVLSCSEGVDCSGFVSRVWGISRSTTSSLPTITKKYSSFSQVQPGDIMNKAGSHVRMIYQVNPNGSYTMVEAAQGTAQGGGDALWKVFYWTYTYSDMQSIVSEGYQPRYYGDGNSDPVTGLDNDDCEDAAELAVSSSADYKLFTVDGATSSGKTIPSCSGWTSSGADDVWFSFTAAAQSQKISVDPVGDLDAVVALYSDCSASSAITCIDVSGGGGLLTELEYARYTVGETYFVRVFDYGTSDPVDGRFNIAVIAEGGAQLCSDDFEPNNVSASLLNVSEYEDQTLNLCLSAGDVDRFQFSGLLSGYTYTATIKVQNNETAGAVINNSGSDLQASFTNKNPLQFSITGSSTGDYSLEIQLTKTVDNTDPVTGLNDDCEDAAELAVSASADYKLFTVDGATSSGKTIPSCSGWTSSGANDVWFSFTAAAQSQTVSVDPVGDLDAVVALYSDCSASSAITCVDVTGGGGLLTELEYAGFTVGKTYLVRVFDYGSIDPIDGGFNIAVIAEGGAQLCSDDFEPNNVSASLLNVSEYEDETLNLCLSAGDVDKFQFSGLLSGYTYTATIKVQNNETAGAVINNSGSDLQASFTNKNPLQFSITGSSTGDYSLEIKLTKTVSQEDQKSLYLSPSNVTAGKVSGMGMYSVGDTAWIAAEPAVGYEFVEWQLNGVRYSGNLSGWIVVAKDMELVAVFKEIDTVSVESWSGAEPLKIYPVPATDNITIEQTGLTGKNYQIFSVQGRFVSEGVFESDVSSVSLDAFSSGIYFIKIDGVVNTRFVKK